LRHSISIGPTAWVSNTRPFVYCKYTIKITQQLLQLGLSLTELYIHVTVHRNRFLFNNQPDALIIQIYSGIKPYIFRASSLPIIRSFLLYIRHW